MVWPAQIPSRNIHAKRKKTTTAVPITPPQPSWKRNFPGLPPFFLLFLRRDTAMAHMRSGADRPTRRNPLAKTTRRARHKVSRALLRAGSSPSTLCRL